MNSNSQRDNFIHFKVGLFFHHKENICLLIYSWISWLNFPAFRSVSPGHYRAIKWSNILVAMLLYFGLNQSFLMIYSLHLIIVSKVFLSFFQFNQTIPVLTNEVRSCSLSYFQPEELLPNGLYSTPDYPYRFFLRFPSFHHAIPEQSNGLSPWSVFYHKLC